MSVKSKYTLLRSIELEIKLGVVLIDTIMTCYVLWLILTNTSTWIIGTICGFTPFGAVELLRVGRLFHLCTTYKLMILHIVAVYCCCIYQARWGFGDVLATMRIIMFFIGIILISIIVFKLCNCCECCNKESCNQDSY